MKLEDVSPNPLKDDIIRVWYIFKDESEGIPDAFDDDTIRGVWIEGTCTSVNDQSFKLRFSKA